MLNLYDDDQSASVVGDEQRPQEDNAEKELDEFDILLDEGLHEEFDTEVEANLTIMHPYLGHGRTSELDEPQDEPFVCETPTKRQKLDQE